MFFNRSDAAGLVQALYAAAAGVGGDWPDFLGLLAGMTHASTTVLLIEEIAGTRHVFPEYASLPPQDLLRRLRGERVYGVEDLPERFESEADLRVMRVALPGGGSVWVILRRDTGAFRSIDGATLASLAPHLPLAVTTWAMQRVRQAQAAMAERLTAGLGAGWIALTASGRVVARDEGLDQVLAACPEVTLSPGGWLEVAEATRARALSQAFEKVRATGQAALVDLATTPQAQILIDLPPDGLALPAETALVGFLRCPPARGPHLAPLLAEATGLAPAEARLALRLADGDTLAEAAEELGLTLETARFYAKKTYAKLGLRGQTDVVRFLQKSAIWWAKDRTD